MSNDEIIREVRKCEAVGMRGVPMVGVFHRRIMEIQCWPRLNELGKEAKP